MSTFVSEFLKAEIGLRKIFIKEEKYQDKYVFILQSLD